MPKAKRIFVISDFKLQKPQAVFVDARRIVKGLIREGHDVLTFSYRNMLMECSPFPVKRFAKRFAKGQPFKIKSISLLGSKEFIQGKRTEKGLELVLPSILPANGALAFRIEVE